MKMRHKKMARCWDRTSYRRGMRAIGDWWSCARWHRQFRSVR